MTNIKQAGVDEGLKVGDTVYTSVHVCGEQQLMSKGVIVSIGGGTAEVDIMSLHGGAPWVQLHSVSSLVRGSQL